MDAWAEYLKAMRRLESQVKLVSFWTLETARATREAAYYTQVTADKVKEAIEAETHCSQRISVCPMYDTTNEANAVLLGLTDAVS